MRNFQESYSSTGTMAIPVWLMLKWIEPNCKTSPENSHTWNHLGFLLHERQNCVYTYKRYVYIHTHTQSHNLSSFKHPVFMSFCISNLSDTPPTPLAWPGTLDNFLVVWVMAKTGWAGTTAESRNVCTLRKTES